MKIEYILRASASLVAMGLSLPLMSAPAVAQSTPAVQSADTVETITVTARKREESDKDVPIAVTAISGETLQARHIDQVKDIAALTPSLNIESDSVGRSLIDIRGIGTTLLDTVQPGIGIFVDGVYMPVTSYLNSPIVDVDHIEVLKGPQGTLFGNNTLGGAINVITRQPGDDVEGMVNANYAGPDDYQSYSASISGPIIDDVLEARIGGAYQSDDGFIKNALVGGDQNPLNQQALNSTVRWQASNDATFTLNGYYDRVHGGVVNYYPVLGPTDYSDKADTNERNLGTYSYAGGNLKGVFDVSSLDTTITAVAAYDERSSENSGDADFGPIDLALSSGSSLLHTGTGELRFDTKWTDQISTLLGVFYDDQILSTSGATTIVPLGLTVPSIARMETKNFAAYGTLFWQLDPTMEFTAGLRWDHQSVGAVGTFNGAFAVPGIKSNELEPRFTLDKHWTPDLMTYVSVARGFRGGGINPPNSPNEVFRGDSVWTYEAGAKSDFFDDRVSLDAAVFYNNYFNFIGQNSLAPAKPPGVGFVGINLNSGHVEAPGAELQGTWKILENWTLDGGVSYVHSRITDGREYVDTTGMGLPSDRILLLPDLTYNIDTNYVVPFGADDAVVFDANTVFKGNRKGSSLQPGFAPDLKAYSLFNASVTWRHDSWDLGVYATNLFNQKYFESYIDKSVLAAAGIPPEDVGILGDLRRVGVTATYRF